MVLNFVGRALDTHSIVIFKFEILISLINV